MTTNDWIGTILVVILTILMASAYFYAFRPSNKDKFENCKNIINQED